MKLWLPSLLLALTACQTSGGAEESTLAVDAEAAPKRVSMEKLRKRVSDADEAHAMASLEFRMKVSERELAEMEAAANSADAAEAIRSARVALGTAKSMRRRFDDLERKVEIGESELSVARAQEGLRKAETDLLASMPSWANSRVAR